MDSLLTPPPSPLKSSFTKRLLQVNHLDAQGFQNWALLPGMLFGADRLWWGAGGPRPRPHEGVDLKDFVDGGGESVTLGEGGMIPALFGGQVVAIFADLLGHSIMVAHPLQQGESRLHSIYAHVEVEPGVALGQQCAAGEIIGRIAKMRNSGVPAHLHLSTFWLSGVLVEALSWSKLGRATNILWCDPLQFIRGSGNRELPPRP